MKVAVVGLGGVGGYFGGKIARAYARRPGHAVAFVARGAHLAAIRTGGLLLKTGEGAFLATPDLATDRASEVGPCDLVLLCVKEYDLAGAAAGLASLLHQDTVILPLLNGVDIAERLRARLPLGVVLGGCVYISSFIEAPGVVHQVGGSCQLLFGPEAGGGEPYRPLEAWFREAGIKAELTADITAALWTKYLFVSPLAGVTSLLDRSFGAVMADPQARGLVRGLMAEIEALARAKKVGLPADCLEGALAKANAFAYETRSSLQLDFAKGGRTELELFLGYAVRTGKALGVPVPCHEELYSALLRRAAP